MAIVIAVANPHSKKGHYGSPFRISNFPWYKRRTMVSDRIGILLNPLATQIYSLTIASDLLPDLKPWQAEIPKQWLAILEKPFRWCSEPALPYDYLS